MHKNDIIDFSRVLLSQMVTFWDAELDEMAALSWFDAINFNYPESTVEDVRLAFIRYLSTSKADFKPKPNNILALMDRKSSGEMAWNVAEKSIRVLGRARSVLFEDPLITSTIIQLGGWVHFCATADKEDQKPFLKRDFIQLYNSGIMVIDKNIPLIGVMAIQNRTLEKEYKYTTIGSPYKPKVLIHSNQQQLVNK